MYKMVNYYIKVVYMCIKGYITSHMCIKGYNIASSSYV